MSTVTTGLTSLRTLNVIEGVYLLNVACFSSSYYDVLQVIHSLSYFDLGMA